MSATMNDAYAQTPQPLTLSNHPRVLLYGALLAAITEQQCVRLVMDELDAGHGGQLITLNLDHLRRFVYDSAYAWIVQGADLIVADGMPLIWASRLQSAPLPERVTGSNLIWSLSHAAAARGRSVFLLGGRNDAAERSAQVLQTAYPRLQIAGVYAPTFGFEQRPAELEVLFEKVRRAQPDIIFVALGLPKEDVLIQQLRSVAPRAWGIGVGITFSWVAGDLRRAPRWMQSFGLEWLHRLWNEPRRLGRRYLVDDLHFALRLFVHAFGTRGTQAFLLRAVIQAKGSTRFLQTTPTMSVMEPRPTTLPSMTKYKGRWQRLWSKAWAKGRQ
jgi:N-acetylglucosaminyldiphosphoundecaprenol N-acetyl-beta-D-mannosaminyltransferase